MCIGGGQADKTGTQGTHCTSSRYTNSRLPSSLVPAQFPGTGGVCSALPPQSGVAGDCWVSAESSQNPASPTGGSPCPCPLSLVPLSLSLPTLLPCLTHLTTAVCPSWCALHPSSNARILGFHTPNPPLGLPQQPLQKPAVLKALAPGEPGGRRCRVGRGRGRAGIPSHPRHISHSGHALASQGVGLSGIQAPHWLPCSRGTPEPRNLGVVGGEGVSALLLRETLETAAGWVGGPRAPWTSGSSST